MIFRYEAKCKIHGIEIGHANSPKECEINAYAEGCDIEEYSLFAVDQQANDEWDRTH